MRKLPHHLVASFKSTLEETLNADLLLHVIDLSHPNYREQMNTVSHVLADLGAGDKPILKVFNKIDLVQEPGLVTNIMQTEKSCVCISAIKGLFLEKLVEKILDFVEHHFVDMTIKLPTRDGKILSQIYKLADVQKIEYVDSMIILNVKATTFQADRIKRLMEKISSLDKAIS